MKEVKNTRKYTPKELEALKEAVIATEAIINENSLNDLVKVFRKFLVLTQDDQAESLLRDYSIEDLISELDKRFGIPKIFCYHEGYTLTDINGKTFCRKCKLPQKS